MLKKWSGIQENTSINTKSNYYDYFKSFWFLSSPPIIDCSWLKWSSDLVKCWVLPGMSCLDYKERMIKTWHLTSTKLGSTLSCCCGWSGNSQLQLGVSVCQCHSMIDINAYKLNYSIRILIKKFVTEFVLIFFFTKQELVGS